MIFETNGAEGFSLVMSGNMMGRCDRRLRLSTPEKPCRVLKSLEAILEAIFRKAAEAQRMARGKPCYRLMTAKYLGLPVRFFLFFSNDTRNWKAV